MCLLHDTGIVIRFVRSSSSSFQFYIHPVDAEAIPNLPLTAHRRPKKPQTQHQHEYSPWFPTLQHPKMQNMHSHNTQQDVYILNKQKTYNIRHKQTCHSHNVIYLNTCTKYVGQNYKKNSDRASHNTDSQSKVTMGIQGPATSTSPDTASTTYTSPIDYLPKSDSIALLNKETYCIHTLQTMERGGINTNGHTTFPISMHYT